LIHEDAGAGIAFDVFEEECRAAARRLRHAVGDLRHFEDRVYFFAYAFELAGFIEGFDPFSEIVADQGFSPVCGTSISTIERQPCGGHRKEKASRVARPFLCGNEVQRDR
jgi:hypothetical protein